MVRGVPAVRARPVAEELKPERRELMLGGPDRLARARRTLDSMSDVMKHLRIVLRITNTWSIRVVPSGVGSITSWNRV